MYSYGLCHFRHDKLLEEIAGRLRRDPQLLDTFTPQGLSNTLLGFANMQYRNPDTLNVVLGAMGKQLGELLPQHFCNAIYSLGKLYHVDVPFMQAVAAAMVHRDIPCGLSP